MIRLAAALWMASAALLPAAGLAQDAAAPAKNPRILVTGKATREAPPDLASVSVGVVAKAPAAAAAIDQASAAAARIAAAARGFGIEARDIQTGTLSLQSISKSVRNPDGTVEQRPDGYQAANGVTVRVRELGRLGEVLRAIIEGGANQIGGLSFELLDPGKLEREALAAAVQDGLRQAAVIAEAAGARLGRIEEIRTGATADRPVAARRYAAGAAAPAGAPVPVEAGSLTVSAEVEIVVSIAQP